MAGAFLEARILRGRGVRLADLLAVLAVLTPCVAASLGGGDALGLRAPFAGFDAQEPGHIVALLCRLTLLFVAIMGPRRATPAVALGLSLLFLGSLAARALVLPDLLATAAAIRLRPPHDVADVPLPRWVVPAVLAVSVLALVPRRPPGESRPPNEPREAVSYWRGRKNLPRARAAALSWARTEASPSDGYLALAAVDWDLGEREKARKVLNKVLTRSDSEAARARAAELQRTWAE